MALREEKGCCAARRVVALRDGYSKPERGCPIPWMCRSGVLTYAALNSGIFRFCRRLRPFPDRPGTKESQTCCCPLFSVISGFCG